MSKWNSNEQHMRLNMRMPYVSISYNVQWGARSVEFKNSLTLMQKRMPRPREEDEQSSIHACRCREEIPTCPLSRS